MCLILFAYKVHPSYPLVLAANRDEFYDRPTQSADFWPDHPQLLAGIDLQEKGTWLGVTKEGKFAAITNYRDPASWKTAAPSRGKLVRDYLVGDLNPENYLKEISAHARDYNGFNLLLGDRENLWVFSNQGDAKKLQPGIYGLSNHLLDTPWPKVQRGKQLLKKALAKKGDALEEALFEMLADCHIPRMMNCRIPVWRQSGSVSCPPCLSPVPSTERAHRPYCFFRQTGGSGLLKRCLNAQSLPWMTGRFSFKQEKKP